MRGGCVSPERPLSVATLNEPLRIRIAKIRQDSRETRYPPSGHLPGSSMDAVAFQHKWIGVTLKERSTAHEHFLDLCRVLDVAFPASADPSAVEEDVILSRLLALNQERAAQQSS